MSSITAVASLEQFDTALLDTSRRDVVALVRIGDQMVSVEFDAHEALLADEEFRHLFGVVAPDLGGHLVLLGTAVGKGQCQRQRRDQPANIVEVDEMHVLARLDGAIERSALPRFELVAKLLVLITILVVDDERIVFVVEILELRIAINTGLAALGAVLSLRVRLRPVGRKLGAAQREFRFRILR